MINSLKKEILLILSMTLPSPPIKFSKPTQCTKLLVISSTNFMQRIKKIKSYNFELCLKNLFFAHFEDVLPPSRFVPNLGNVPNYHSYHSLTPHTKSFKLNTAILTNVQKSCFLLILSPFLPDFGPTGFFFKNLKMSLSRTY